MDEDLVDIYDSDMNLLGVASKDQAHQEGLWHKVAMCWIVSEDGNLWLQRRSADKKVYPSLFDTSCAGHVLVGEAPKNAALRILNTELGIQVKEDNLSKLFTHKIIVDNNGFHNREFCPTYLLKTQLKLRDLKLNSKQVDAVFEADIQTLIDLFLGEIKQTPVHGLKCNGEKFAPLRVVLKKEDFYPHSDKYYQKLFTTIQRVIDNQ